MSSSAIHVSPSLELISASRRDSSCCTFPRLCTLVAELPWISSSSRSGRTPVCVCCCSESVSLWVAELFNFFTFGCLEFLLRLMRALFSPSLLPLSAAADAVAEPSDSFFSFLSFFRSALEAAWLSYRESFRRILSSKVLSECMRRILLPLFARALRTNVWIVWMSEPPSAQVLPAELLPPPSAESPELCAELDDVGDQELSFNTATKKKHKSLQTQKRKEPNVLYNLQHTTTYLFRTRDVASVSQDKAAEFIEVLYCPLFPLWWLQTFK